MGGNQIKTTLLSHLVQADSRQQEVLAGTRGRGGQGLIGVAD
jgi:hypothetical protein